MELGMAAYVSEWINSLYPHACMGEAGSIVFLKEIYNMCCCQHANWMFFYDPSFVPPPEILTEDVQQWLSGIMAWVNSLAAGAMLDPYRFTLINEIYQVVCVQVAHHTGVMLAQGYTFMAAPEYYGMPASEHQAAEDVTAQQ